MIQQSITIRFKLDVSSRDKMFVCWSVGFYERRVSNNSELTNPLLKYGTMVLANIRNTLLQSALVCH